MYNGLIISLFVSLHILFYHYIIDSVASLAFARAMSASISNIYGCHSCNKAVEVEGETGGVTIPHPLT